MTRRTQYFCVAIGAGIPAQDAYGAARRLINKKAQEIANELRVDSVSVRTLHPETYVIRTAVNGEKFYAFEFELSWPAPQEMTFEIGDRVKKIGGDYEFEGVVVAAFDKLSGKRRYVVEDDRGVLHIYSGWNLRPVETID